MSTSATPSPPASGQDATLADMVRILDVAAEFRADRELASREFAVEETRKLLAERLLASAKLSGDPVTPAEIEAAIEQYFQSQHTFHEPKLGFSTLLAHAYVRRTWIALAGGLVIAAVCVGWVLFNSSSGLLSPTANETRQYAAALAEGENQGKAILTALAEPQFKPQVEEQLHQLRAAVERRDRPTLDAVQQKLAAWARVMNEEYEIRVVADTNAKSGARRDYTDEQGTRVSGYYLIVQARNAAGAAIPRTVTDGETQKPQTVTTWGERVPAAIYERIKQDKQSDGILNETLFAAKRRGHITEEMQMKDDAGQPLGRLGQITQW